MAETFDGSSTVRLLDNDRAEPVIRSVYEAVRSTRTGMLTRSDSWWSHRLMADVESWRGGKSARRYAVFGEDDEVSGYAVYRQKAKWEDFVADGEVDVVEVVTTTTAAHAGLWAFLTSIDLFPRIEYWNLPIDDPLPSLVTDQRRVRRSLVDALWIRLMDVPTALEARRYEEDGSVIFETIDPARSGRSATFRLEVVEGNARCTAVQGAPDLTMRADVLGHLYLGGGNALTMARAGRIGGDEPSIRTLHRLFRTDSMPWCPEVF
jgi:predicted acetyltransferase